MKLHLNRYGYVDGEILWMIDKFIKINFNKKIGIFPFIYTKNYTEIFHVSEILNFNEVYRDSNTKIKIYPYVEFK
jgi:hypothetical protein